MKLYENIVIGNFLYALGFAIRAKSDRGIVPSVVNLLQQTPADKELADVLLEFPGVVRLIEFKQLSNKSKKERGRYKALKASIGDSEEMIRISKSIHWFIETKPNNKTFVSRIVPYLDAYAEPIDNKKHSLEQFIEEIAEEAVHGKTKFSNEELRRYLSFISKCQGSGEVGTGGLLLAIDAQGYLRFVELTDMIELRLQHRAFVEKLINEMQQTLDRESKQELTTRNRSLTDTSLEL
ncbi:MAG: hypothetical protein KME17_24865 [Cyanosarcina radialis HA8281-LM2]|nr:hypothetical protein [Cyanosarcina radialis HA8281-LM2]